jgi:catalase
MTAGTGFMEETVAPDEAALIAEFISFLKEASAARARARGAPVRRFNQARAAACVDAEFTVLDGLPAAHRIGLFAVTRSYHATIRFASATSANDRERDTRGMAISVIDAMGTNLTPGHTRQDFVLNSHPVMVAPDAREFLALLRANEAGGLKRILYFAGHPKAARIGFAARQHHSCHLDIPYWSTTPYAFGPDRAVKYMARPVSDRTSKLPGRLTDNYLQEALRAHLEEGEARFDFMVQFRVDDTRTPLDDATVEWKPEDAPWHRVARITIPRQRLDGPTREKACEDMTFNPWHALTEHRPLGSMNRARREIYRALSEFRRSGPGR